MPAVNRRRLLGWLAVVTVTVAAAACAGNDAESPVAATPSRSAASPTVSDPSEPTSALTDPPPTTAATDGTLTIVAGGDVLLHPPTWEQADADAGAAGDGDLDFGPALVGIEPVVAGADLALCHLETPLAERGGPYAGYPSFAGPPEIVDALAGVGFDACSVASNHSFDQGAAGLARTTAALSSAGITPYGAPLGDRPPNPVIVDVGDVRVGLLSYTYGMNGGIPGGSEDAVDFIDPGTVLADAAAARAAGAAIVVVSLHWGDEYSHDINTSQADLAPALLASPDIDLLIGHHAHVVQPYERLGGEWVAYGLGNMLAAHSTPGAANREGVLASFTFAEHDGRWQVVEAGYLPIVVDRGPPLRMVAVPVALASDLDAETRERYEEALARTREVVRGRGAEDVVELTGDGA